MSHWKEDTTYHFYSIFSIQDIQAASNLWNGHKEETVN